MRLAKVVGTVTATVKDRAYEGRRLMVVAILDPTGKPTGAETLAADTVGAGVGDHVLVLKEGNSAASILGEWMALQEMIVGVVDQVSLRQEKE